MSQAIGLIKDIPTCKEVIERTVVEAEELLEAVRGKITG
jgi:NAD(P)H-dependent flavin oxidoreductase YrpB (nitropropane dioxygenase family)